MHMLPVQLSTVCVWICLNSFPFNSKHKPCEHHKFYYELCTNLSISSFIPIQKEAFNILCCTATEISWVWEMDTFYDLLTNYCAIATCHTSYICWPHTILTYLSSHDFRMNMTFLSYPFSSNSDLFLFWNSELVFIKNLKSKFLFSLMLQDEALSHAIIKNGKLFYIDIFLTSALPYLEQNLQHCGQE